MANYNVQLDLVDLTEGTAKQIAWATKIRSQKVCKILDYVETYLDSLKPEYRASAWFDFVEKCGKPKARITSALFWIENRYKSANWILDDWPPTRGGAGSYHRGAKGGRGNRVRRAR